MVTFGSKLVKAGVGVVVCVSSARPWRSILGRRLVLGAMRMYKTAVSKVYVSILDAKRVLPQRCEWFAA